MYIAPFYPYVKLYSGAIAYSDRKLLTGLAIAALMV